MRFRYYFIYWSHHYCIVYNQGTDICRTRLVFIFSLILLNLPAFVAGQNIMGFAPYYRTFSADFDFTKYTHVIFFTLWPDSSGNIIWPEGNDSTYITNKFETIRSKAQPEGIKVLIAFGGIAEAGSKYFSQMAMDSASLYDFTSNAIDLCKKWGADGIDIDWEWGEKLDPGDDLIAGYENLMTRLRTVADQESLLLTTDVSASSWFGDNYPENGVDQAHFVNLMSYTYNGSWSSTANHHSSLKNTRDIGLAYWTGKGIAKSKINIGVPFFAQEYTGATDPGQAFSAVQALTYNEVTDHISAGFSVIEDNENGTYCYSDAVSSIVFYDSPENLKHKMHFAMDNDYAGVFIWEIGQDDPDQSLSNAIYDAKNDIAISTASNMISLNNYQISFSRGNGINISTASDHPFKVSLFNLEGKKLGDYQASTHLLSIKTNHLPGGIYILSIDNGLNIIRSKVLVAK